MLRARAAVEPWEQFPLPNYTDLIRRGARPRRAPNDRIFIPVDYAGRRRPHASSRT